MNLYEMDKTYRIYLLWLNVIHCITASSVLERLREACPYSNFCTINSLKQYNNTGDSVPCCYDCYCDEHCSVFGDCCPDVKPNKPTQNTGVLDCKSVHVVTERTKKQLAHQYSSIEREQSLYRLIDFCPTEYDDASVIDACKGTFSDLPQFTDLVLVSDENGTPYKNKYCAACHGISDVTSWSLKIETCVEEIGKVQLTLSEATFFVLNYCLMTSERPRDVTTMPRMLECPKDQTCSGTDQVMVDDCINGPYMPYVRVARTVSLYKNVFCYQSCTGEPETGLCPIYGDILSRYTVASYQVLLNLGVTSAAKTPATTGCGEAELKDIYSGCRRLYCPPFKAVSYGKYIPLHQDVTNLHLNVIVLYRPTDALTNTTLTSIQRYNETMKQHYIRHIYRKHRYPNCNIKEVIVAVNTDKISRNFVRLFLRLVYDVNQECSLDYIAERIKNRKFIDEEESWFVNNRLYKMEGQFSFYEDPFVDEDTTYHLDHLMFVSSDITRLFAIKTFFLCPYFKLSLDEYLDMERRGKNSKDYPVIDLSPSARHLNGYYPISDIEVAVCVDTYLPNSGKVGIGAHILCVIPYIALKISEANF